MFPANSFTKITNLTPCTPLDRKIIHTLVRLLRVEGRFRGRCLPWTGNGRPGFLLRKASRQAAGAPFAAIRHKKIDIFCRKICRMIFFVYLCTTIKPIGLSSDGAIAQLVEQRTENPCVPGSIPGGTTLKRSKKLQNPDFQTKSGFSLFPGSARNSGFRHLLVEQSVEMKTILSISTEFAPFSLNCNILHNAKSGLISYICRTS